MRNQGWERMLADYLEENKARPTVFGEYDCCLFTGDIYHLFHGVDLTKGFRGKYKTMRGATKLIRDILKLPKDISPLDIVYELCTYMAKKHGITEKEPAFINRGDAICYLDTTTGQHALGVLGMNGNIVGPGKNKLEELPIEKATIFGVWAI